MYPRMGCRCCTRPWNQADLYQLATYVIASLLSVNTHPVKEYILAESIFLKTTNATL